MLKTHAAILYAKNVFFPLGKTVVLKGSKAIATQLPSSVAWFITGHDKSRLMWVANHLLSRWYTSTNQQTDGGNFAIPTQRASHRPKTSRGISESVLWLFPGLKIHDQKGVSFFLSLDLYGLSWSWWWFQIFFYVYPEPWGNDPTWRAYCSNELVQPPPSGSLNGSPEKYHGNLRYPPQSYPPPNE